MVEDLSKKQFIIALKTCKARGLSQHNGCSLVRGRAHSLVLKKFKESTENSDSTFHFFTDAEISTAGFLNFRPISQVFLNYFLRIHSNIILPSKSTLS